MSFVRRLWLNGRNLHAAEVDFCNSSVGCGVIFRRMLRIMQAVGQTL
jgi:hypothetical protein